jgi:hypothetical protein
MNKIIGGLAGQAAEAVDGLVFGLVFEAAAKKIPEEHHEFVQSFLDAVVSGDYESVKDVSSDYIVELIKSPLGDDLEKLITDTILDLIFKIIDRKKTEVLAATTVGGGGPAGHPEGD